MSAASSEFEQVAEIANSHDEPVVCYATKRSFPKPYSPITHLMESSEAQPGFRAILFVETNRIINDEYPFAVAGNSAFLISTERCETFKLFGQCYNDCVQLSIPVYVQLLLFFKKFWPDYLERYLSERVREMRTNSEYVKMSRSLSFQVKKIKNKLYMTVY